MNQQDPIPEPVNVSEDYVLGLRDFYNVLGMPFDSFNAEIVLEDGLERVVGKALEITGAVRLPGAGRYINIEDIEMIRRSKTELLRDTAKNISAIKGMIPSGQYDKFCEEFGYFFTHSLMGEPDVILMNAIVGKYHEQNSMLERKNGEKMLSREYYNGKKQLAGNIQNLKDQLVNWVASNYASYFFLRNIADRSRSRIAEGIEKSDAEPDYGAIMDGILDFMEALYLPFEGRSCSYPAKDGYWRNLTELHQKGLNPEQLGEFASAVRYRIKHGFPIADAVALERQNFEPDNTTEKHDLDTAQGGGE